jgi:multisubunit Na+/H+ antiporter MnhE subunit
MVTLKNVLGIIGLVVIAFFWVIITGTIYGGVFVLGLIVVVVVLLTIVQRRKRAEPQTKPDEDTVR